MSVIGNLMNLANVNQYLIQVIIGLIILSAVIVNTIKKGKILAD